MKRTSIQLTVAEPLPSDLAEYARPGEIAVYEQETARVNEILDGIRKQQNEIVELHRNRSNLRTRLRHRRNYASRPPSESREEVLAKLMDRDARIHQERKEKAENALVR